LFKFVKSTHIRYLLLAFFTIITLTSHSGYVTSCINPIDMSLSTLLDMAFRLSPPIFLFFYHTGGKLGSIFNQYEATTGLIPDMSFIRKAKLLLYNTSSSMRACFCRPSRVQPTLVTSFPVGPKQTSTSSLATFILTSGFSP